MKPRRVVVTIEAVSDGPIEEIENDLHGWFSDWSGDYSFKVDDIRAALALAKGGA